MKQQQPVGLILESAARESRILGLKKLADQIGPIKSATFPVARRMSNALRAGYAVRDYDELKAAALVFIFAPDSAVPLIVDGLIKSTLDFHKLSFLVCESWLTVDVLNPLKERGACIATLVEMPSLGRDCFVVEGDFCATKRVQKFLRNDLSVYDIQPNCKHLLFAAQLLSTTIQMDLFKAAHEILKASGLSARNALSLTSQMAQKLLRSSNKQTSSKRHRTLVEHPSDTEQALISTLKEQHTELADLIITHLARMNAIQNRNSKFACLPNS
jgi:hypothetical protein